MNHSKKVFELLKECLRSSVKYNTQKKEIELNIPKLNQKIDIVLENLASNKAKKDSLKQHIKIACEKIAEEVTYTSKDNLKSFSGMILKVQNETDCIANHMLRSGFMQPTIFAKQELTKSLTNSNIDGPLNESINSVVEKVFQSFKSSDLDGALESFSELSKISQGIEQYIKDMELPTWFGEMFLRKTLNITVGYNNSSAIKDLSNKFKNISYKLDDSTKVEVESLIRQCEKNASSVEETLQNNNYLLSKIETDIGGKKYSAEKIHASLESFKAPVAASIIMMFLQQDNKDVGHKMQEFSTALRNTPKYFDSADKIDEYIQSVNEVYSRTNIETTIQRIIDIENKLCVKSNISQKIQQIPSMFENLKQDLITQKNLIMQNSHSPIASEDIQWDRTYWQSFKTLCASVSKFFIGDSLHTSIYGYASGVEELRRCAEEARLDSDKMDFESVEGIIWEV